MIVFLVFTFEYEKKLSIVCYCVTYGSVSILKCLFLDFFFLHSTTSMLMILRFFLCFQHYFFPIQYLEMFKTIVMHLIFNNSMGILFCRPIFLINQKQNLVIEKSHRNSYIYNIYEFPISLISPIFCFIFFSNQ